MNGYCAVRNLAAAFFLSVMLVVIAPSVCCGQTPGVTDDEILIGCTADLSGPIAFMGRGWTEGARLHFNYINKKGGIHGRSIRMLVEDDLYQSPRALQGARKLVTRDNVFIMYMVVGSVQSNAMYPFLEARGVPLIMPATQAHDLVNPPRKYLFLGDTTFRTGGKVAVEYFVTEMGMEDSRIACIYQDDTPGHDWFRGVTIAADHYGIDVLDLPYRRAAVDFSSQVARCKSANIGHIFMWTLHREPALIMREAQRQNYRATFITSYASMQAAVIELAGDAIDYSRGFYGVGSVFEPDREDQRPEIAQYIEIAKRQGFDYRNQNYLYGYLSAMVLIEGLERAGRNLTREGLIRALETFDNFEPGVNAPITWGPNIREGAKAVQVAKAIDGDWVSLLPDGEWLYSGIEE